MNIAVDAMGGDHAATVTVQGALWVQSELVVNITLVGDQDLLTGELSGRKKTGNGRTDAVVSAGNSGATRGAAVLILEG